MFSSVDSSSEEANSSDQDVLLIESHVQLALIEEMVDRISVFLGTCARKSEDDTHAAYSVPALVDFQKVRPIE